MTNYIFSPSKNAFYPYLLKGKLSFGRELADGPWHLNVDEAIFNENNNMISRPRKYARREVMACNMD